MKRDRMNDYTKEKEQELPVMLSVRQCADRLGLPYQLVLKIVKEGKVLSFKSGAKYWVNFKSLCSYLEGEDYDN